jgi:TctA family transporter
MRPLTVITGIVLGSCLAITVSLAAVLFVFFILGDDYPRVRHEFRPLLSSVFLFLSMTIISAASFYSLVINHRARLLAQLLLWAGIAGTVWYYLP